MPLGEDYEMKNLFLVFALLSLGGCASEVDKCVAAWENANPNEGNDYCRPSDRFSETGECMPNTGISRDQALATTRQDCMRAANGR